MEEIKEKVNYCLNCPVKPCANKGCPLGNNIPGFIKAMKEEDYNMKNINNIVTLAVANTLSNACEKAKRGEIQKGKSRFLDVRANNKKLYVEFVKENCSICEFLTDETIDKLIELSRD